MFQKELHSPMMSFLQRKRKTQNEFLKILNEQLIELQGVGDYTAKAVLGIAYNQPVMPLDTNIKRIIF